MSLPDRELLELNELCQALIDGAISDTDRARLEQRLAGSKEARRFYVRTLALSASLYEYAGEMQSEAPDAAPTPAHERPARGLWWAAGSLAAAAMLVVGLWFGQHTARRGAEPVAFSEDAELGESDELVARLSGGKDVRWNGTALAPGEELHRGQQLQLVSGIAEIAFDSGAVVMLEGPASFEVTSAWEAVLHRGTLKAQVPKEAIGFRVSNPTVEVVDLGTEFSMIAEEHGETEIFVLKGSVETRAGESNAEPVVLRERDARRFAKGKRPSEVADREFKWRKLARLAALERTPRPLHFLHCSFDVKEDWSPVSGEPWANEAEVSGSFTMADQPVVPGHFRDAFQMSAISYGELSLSAELRMAPVQTVAFWVKVPSWARRAESGPIVSWSRSGPRAGRVAIGLNGLPSLGPVGALRTSLGRGSVLGQTSVCDEQWHHVAVILTPGRRNTEKVQVRQYIDGCLDGVSSRRLGKHGRPVETTIDESILMGRASAKALDNFFGAMDELYVVDRALSPQEIHQLMVENRLTATPTAAEP